MTTTKIETTTAFPIDHPGVLYSSLSLNVFLALILIFVGFLKCKKAVVRRYQAFRRARNPIFVIADSSSEELDTNERNPLLRTRSNQTRSNRRSSRTSRSSLRTRTPVGTPQTNDLSASFLLHANLNDLLGGPSNDNLSQMTDMTNLSEARALISEARGGKARPIAPPIAPTAEKSKARAEARHGTDPLTIPVAQRKQRIESTLEMGTFKKPPSPPKRTSILQSKESSF